MKVNYFIAFDLGATSGRTILGKLEGEKLALEEITRFPNQMLQWNGHFYWDNTFSKPDVAVERTFLLEHLFIV